MKQFVRVVVRSPEDRFLILREQSRPWWNFPGGKVEEAEVPIDAACRELLEEVDLEVAPGELELLKHGIFDIVGISWEGFFYFARRASGNAKVREVESTIEFSWVGLEELTALSALPGLLADVASMVQARGLLTRLSEKPLW